MGWKAVKYRSDKFLEIMRSYLLTIVVLQMNLKMVTAVSFQTLSNISNIVVSDFMVYYITSADVTSTLNNTRIS
jgi:hypothetical protein